MTKIHCNAGVVNVTHKGKLPGYGLVWFNIANIANIANILSMAKITKK